MTCSLAEQVCMGHARVVLGAASKDLPKWSAFFARQSLASDAVSYFEQRGATLPAVQGLPTAQAGDLLHALLPTPIQTDFTRADVGKLLRDVGNASSWSDLLTDYGRTVRTDMGISDPSRAGELYGQVVGWWARQALGSVAYPVTNLVGGALGAATQGISPLTIGRDVLDNAGAIWRGQPFHLQEATDLVARTGEPILPSLNRQASQAVATQLGSVGPNAGRDAVIVGALGALGEGASGLVVGGLTGAALSPFLRKVQAVSEGIETVLRERGWVQGMSRELVKSAADMETAVRSALGSNTGLANQLAQTIQARGGQIGADEITAHLRSTANVSPHVLGTVERDLDGILYAASQKGKATSEAFNFNYDDLSNVERAIRNVAPFSTWLMKAIPYYFEQGARHPWAVQVLRDYQAESDRIRRERGLTNRVSGALPSGLGSQIVGTLLGRPVEAFFNPLGSLLPMGNVQQGLERADYAQTPSGKALAYGEALGLGLNPVLGLGARVAGIGDPDEPAQGMPLRAAGVVQALTGVDLGRGSRDLEKTIRESLPGRGQVTDLLDVATERRLDELALRDTGHTIGERGAPVQEYLRAKATHSGPQWDRARAEVIQERGLQGVVGFFNSQIRPQALVMPEEAAIRQAQTDRVLSRDFGTALGKLKSTPDQEAPRELQAQMWTALQTIAERTGEPIPENALTIMATPSVAGLSHLSGEIFKWEAQANPLITGYSGTGTPERRELLAALQAYQGAPLLPSEAQAAVLNRDPRTGRLAALQNAERQGREGIVRQSPLLQEYLDWKRRNPNGDVDGFLAQWRR